jgi:hypothetical protein
LSLVCTKLWREALLCKGCKTKGKGKGKGKGSRFKQRQRKRYKGRGPKASKARGAHQGKGCLASRG